MYLRLCACQVEDLQHELPLPPTLRWSHIGNSGTWVPLFLIDLKAGGVGLNLPQADTVIHYDPQSNPAVETQATDRAHRIGQTHSLWVVKRVAQGTIEAPVAWGIGMFSLTDGKNLSK